MTDSMGFDPRPVADIREDIVTTLGLEGEEIPDVLVKEGLDIPLHVLSYILGYARGVTHGKGGEKKLDPDVWLGKHSSFGDG